MSNKAVVSSAVGFGMIWLTSEARGWRRVSGSNHGSYWPGANNDWRDSSQNEFCQAFGKGPSVCTISESASTCAPNNVQNTGHEARSSNTRHPNAQMSDYAEAGRLKSISSAKYSAGVPGNGVGGLFRKNDSPKSMMRMLPVKHFSSIGEYWMDSTSLCGACGPTAAPERERTLAVRGVPRCW